MVSLTQQGPTYFRKGHEFGTIRKLFFSPRVRKMNFPNWSFLSEVAKEKAKELLQFRIFDFKRALTFEEGPLIWYYAKILS